MRPRPVAVVQHEPSVPPGSITDVLERAGIDHFVVQAWEENAWPTAGDIGALVVMGGTMNVDELDRFLGTSRALMAEAIERRLPTLGVCLGSQMMARVLGGDVHRASPRNAMFSKLDVAEGAGDDPLIAAFAGDTEVLQFHEDTFTVPPGARALATSAASGLQQAFRYGDNAYAIQFHFEVDAKIVRDWCRNIGEDELAEAWGTSEAALLNGAGARLRAQREAGEELVAEFLALLPQARRPAPRYANASSRESLHVPQPGTNP
jgi:GMP synthase (glutamine-hydrolysing)